MAEILTHPFVSVKADSPDPSLVSANEWNDGHLFTGGAEGQKLIYDSTQPKHVRWTDGTVSYNNTTGSPGFVASPQSNVSPVTVVTGSNCLLVVDVLVGISTNDGSGGHFYLVNNGVDVGSSGFIAGANTPFHTVVTVGAGTQNLSLRLEKEPAGGTINYFASLSVLKHGI
jgi:hypothetical protein